MTQKTKTPAFFYVAEFDGQVHEIKFTQEKYNKVMELWRNKDIIFFPELVSGIAGTNIKKVLLGGDEYENYIDMARPNVYVKGGLVYDRKSNRVIRTLAWKQEEMAKQKKLQAPKEKPMTPEEQARSDEKWAEVKREMAKRFGWGKEKRS